MNPWIFSTVIFFLLVLFYQIRDLRETTKRKRNSQIFDSRFDNVWKKAAHDWTTDEDDERSFEDFFADTINLCAAKIRRDS